MQPLSARPYYEPLAARCQLLQAMRICPLRPPSSPLPTSDARPFSTTGRLCQRGRLRCRNEAPPMTSPDYPLKTYKFGHSDLPTAHSPFPASMQPDHNAALDGIRGGAILMVIAWHQYACTPHPPPTHVFGLVERITSYGWSGCSYSSSYPDS